MLFVPTRQYLPFRPSRHLRPSLHPLPLRPRPNFSSFSKKARVISQASLPANSATPSQPATVAAQSPPQAAPPSLSFLRLALPEWRPLLLSIFASLLSSSILLLTPIAFGKVLDIITSFHITGPSLGLARLSEGARRLLVIYLLGSLTKFAEVALARRAGERVVANLRSRVFSALVRSDVATLDKSSTGELLSRLSSDTSVLQRVLTDDFVKLMQGALETLVGCIMLFVLCKPLALFVYLTVPLTIGAGMWYGNRTARLAKQVSEAFARASQVAAEQLDGIRIVKSFGREAFSEMRYDNRVKDVLKLGEKAAVADGVLQMWNRTVFQLNTCAIFYMGGRFVAAGSLGVGAMMSFVLYTSNLMVAVGKLSSGIGEVIRAGGAVERIMRILATRPSIERKIYSRKGAMVGYGVEKGGALEFRNVSFRYPGSNRDVLKNIDFEVAAGGSLALIGESGAGKSTTLALLSRFYDPTSGEILLDGRPLSEYDVRKLREKIVGTVSQDAYVISGTIADNIGFGREDATREEIEEAANAAGVMQFANRLVNGLDSSVVGLSGGEQQRLMIARCLLKQPKVMVLDEFSSKLDRVNEALVNETVEKLIRDEDRTVILISHRLATVRHCDRIVVFEKGEVVEQGSHDELLDMNGAYRRLLNAVR